MNPLPKQVSHLPRPFWINALLRSLMRWTRQRGLLTLARINARWFPRGEIIALPTGNELFIPANPHFIAYVLSCHEHHITEIMRRKIRPGDLCVDAGANLGYFTCIMAALCAPAGLVLAYEPDQENFDVLALNARMTCSLSVEVRVFRAAVSNARVPLRLVRSANRTLHQVEPVLTLHADQDTVPCVRLGDSMDLVGKRVDFLKVDVEGHEFPVLEGCADLLDQHRLGTAVVEISPGDTARRIQALMQRWCPAIKCWMDHTWKVCPLESLPYRTDVWFDFG
jgi:FkbM family methyltransferase